MDKQPTIKQPDLPLVIGFPFTDEQQKESKDDIWRDFSRLYGNWGTISQEFINTIKTQFTITRR